MSRLPACCLDLCHEAEHASANLWGHRICLRPTIVLSVSAPVALVPHRSEMRCATLLFIKRMSTNLR